MHISSPTSPGVEDHKQTGLLFSTHTTVQPKIRKRSEQCCEQNQERWIPPSARRGLLYDLIFPVCYQICSICTIQYYESCLKSSESDQSQCSTWNFVQRLGLSNTGSKVIGLMVSGMIYAFIVQEQYTRCQQDTLQSFFVGVCVLVAVGAYILLSVYYPASPPELASSLASAITAAMALSVVIHWVWRRRQEEKKLKKVESAGARL